MTRWLIIMGLMGALLLPQTVLAQELSNYDTDQPIEITADSLEVIQPQKKAIFKGRVLAKQGSVNLKADRMTVFYSEGGNKESGANAISKIEVDGNVFLATSTETAKGTKGVYDVTKKEIRLTGDVVLTREKNVLNGSSLVYNLASGKSLLTGGVSGSTGETSGGRVRGLFIPKNATSQ